jgi:hypothetical protein
MPINRSIFRSAFGGVVLVCLPCLVSQAAGTRPTIEALDPAMSISAAMSKGGSDCHIIIQDGKPYRVCPFVAPIEVRNLIKSLKNK